MADAASAVESTPAADTVADLEAAYHRVEELEAEIDEIGESNVEAAADAYRNATRLLDRYADSATGTGDFKAYLQFQNQFIALADGINEAVPGAEGFQRASDRMDKRRLNESDFEFAREQIQPAGEAVDLLERREAAYSDYRSARHDAKTRRAELADEVDRLRRIRRLGDADLDTSLEPLREPIEAYNAAVRSAFETFRTSRSARELFDLLGAGAERPLVGVDRPPRDLVEYIDSVPAGEEPLSTLREYAEYSPSKLEHYVADPGALRSHVAVHGTYLDRLGPGPLLIEWPPAEAGILRAWLRELAALVRRLDSAAESADTDRDASIEHYRRQLARLTRTDDYERLRRVAVADAELDAEEFDRLATGAVDDDLAAVEAGVDALDNALETYVVD